MLPQQASCRPCQDGDHLNCPQHACQCGRAGHPAPTPKGHHAMTDRQHSHVIHDPDAPSTAAIAYRRAADKAEAEAVALEDKGGPHRAKKAAVLREEARVWRIQARMAEGASAADAQADFPARP